LFSHQNIDRAKSSNCLPEHRSYLIFAENIRLDHNRIPTTGQDRCDYLVGDLSRADIINSGIRTSLCEVDGNAFTGYLNWGLSPRIFALSTYCGVGKRGMTTSGSGSFVLLLG